MIAIVDGFGISHRVCGKMGHLYSVSQLIDGTVKNTLSAFPQFSVSLGVDEQNLCISIHEPVECGVLSFLLTGICMVIFYAVVACHGFTCHDPDCQYIGYPFSIANIVRLIGIVYDLINSRVAVCHFCFQIIIAFVFGVIIINRSSILH